MQDNTVSMKQLAKEAKARMKSGFWKNVKLQRQDAVGAAVSSGRNADTVIKDYSQMLKAKIYRDLSDEDELFYLKVCELLESQEVITNPLGRLADEEVLATLTNEAKQYYMLEISHKYKKMKERFERERVFLSIK